MPGGGGDGTRRPMHAFCSLCSLFKNIFLPGTSRFFLCCYYSVVMGANDYAFEFPIIILFKNSYDVLSILCTGCRYHFIVALEAGAAMGFPNSALTMLSALTSSCSLISRSPAVRFDCSWPEPT